MINIKLKREKRVSLFEKQLTNFVYGVTVLVQRGKKSETSTFRSTVFKPVMVVSVMTFDNSR